MADSLPPDTSTRSLRDSLSSALASSRGILVVVPAIVALLGLALTLLWQSAMRSSNIESAKSKFVAETQVVAQTIDESLAQADPIRARLHEIAASWKPEEEPTVHAYELSDLLLAHPGVVYVSVSFPDGTFSGAFYEEGNVRFQVSRMVGADASMKTVWDPTHRTGLVKVRDEAQTYDPRKRSFYSVATSSDHAVFTDPYPFFRTWVTGITSAEAVRNGDGSIHAVVTIDFDVQALSSVIASAPAPPGSRFVLSTDDGTILAIPGLRERYPDLEFPHDRALRASDVPDPLLSAIIARSEPDHRIGRLDVEGRRYLTTSLRVGAHEGLPWRVAVAEPEANFLGSLPRYQTWSLVASGGALAFAIAISILFARHVTKAKREILRARAEARAAVGKARELGSYRLVERLAAGGMGELWQGEHRLLARPAAVKLIRMEEGTSKADAHVAEERFRREAQTLATLESRHTVNVFDYGAADDGTLYLVMELLHGLDLEKLVEMDGPQPAARVIAFLLQALGSLGEAHEEGLVHRDIKPANLFLSRAADEVDILKVVDFGLVRAADEDRPSKRRPVAFDPVAGAEAMLTSKKGFVGTPAYMAPEQILQKSIDGRADLYALACVAFFLLTGQCVFGSGASVTVIVGHMTMKPPSLRDKTSGWLPLELETLVNECLAKEKEARPATARVMVERLRAIAIPEEHAWTETKARAFWEAFEEKQEAARREKAKLGTQATMDARQLVVRATPD